MRPHEKNLKMKVNSPQRRETKPQTKNNLHSLQ
jgi:hypothetical protein